MPSYILPPEVTENRSDERSVFSLLNALRRAFVMLSSGAGTAAALFSTALGRGDSTNTTSGNEDQFILQMELPTVFPVFQFSMGGMLLSVAGNATVRARLGGTWNAFDGAVIAQINGPGVANTLEAVAGTGAVVANASKLLKLTLQSSAPTVKATFVGGFVIGS